MLRFSTCCLLLACSVGCMDSDRAPAPANEKPRPAKPARDSAGKPYDFSRDLTVELARQLIPQAASFPRADFERILKDTPVRIDEIQNQSLTALLLAIDPLVAEEQNAESRRAFHYIGSPHVRPNPYQLREAVSGGEDADSVSIIQPDYITNCTSITKGDRAEGRVAFRAPGLYVGEAKFTAERIEGGWRIVSFQVPEYSLTTNRRPDGTWKLDEDQMLLGISEP